MAAHTLTATIANIDGEAQADIAITVTPTSADKLLPVGDDVVQPLAQEGTTDSNGNVEFEVLPTSESGTKYVVQVGDDYRAIFAMPDTDTTLAAAIGYPLEDITTPPYQGWRLQATRPDTPATGDGSFNAETGILAVFDGNDWQEFGSVDTSNFVRLDDYNVQVGDIETDIQTLTSRVGAEETVRAAADTTLQGNIDAEETARSSADTALGGRIDTEIATRFAGDSALNTRLTTAEGQISALETADSTQDTSISGLQGRVSTAETDISALETTQASQGTSITSLQTTQGTQNTSLISQGARLTTAEGEIDTLQTQQGTNTAAIETNRQDIATNTAAIAAIDTGGEGPDLTGYATTTALETEATTRAAADTTLQANIDAISVPDVSGLATTTALTAETTARTTADTALGTRVTSLEGAPAVHYQELSSGQWQNTGSGFEPTSAILSAVADMNNGDFRIFSAAGASTRWAIYLMNASGNLVPVMDGIEVRELLQNTNVPSRLDTIETDATALTTRVATLESGGGGGGDGTANSVTVTLLNTAPENPVEGDIWLWQLSTATDSPTLLMRVYDGSAWHFPTALVGNRGTANPSSHELTFGNVVVDGETVNDVIGYVGANGTHFLFPSTEPLSTVRAELDAAVTTLDTNTTNITNLTTRVGTAETNIGNKVDGDLPGFYRVTASGTDASTLLAMNADGTVPTSIATTLNALTPTPPVGSLAIVAVGVTTWIWVLKVSSTSWRVMFSSNQARELATNTAFASRIDTVETTLAGIPTSVSDAITQSELDTAIEGIISGNKITIGETEPANPSAGDLWIKTIVWNSSNFTHTGRYFKVYDGSSFVNINAAKRDSLGVDFLDDAAGETGDIIWGGTGGTHPERFMSIWTKTPHGSADDWFFMRLTNSSHVNELPYQLRNSINTNTASIAVNTANISGETTQRINADAALEDRIADLETGSQLSQVTDETLSTADTDITVFEFGALDTEDEVYLSPARAIDNGDTPDFPIVAEPTLGNGWENTSSTFVAGQSVLPFGTVSGNEFFVYAKGVLSAAAVGSVHTLFASSELTCEIIPQAANTQIKIYPPGSSGTTLTVPVAVGTGGVGAFSLGVSLLPQSDGTLDACAAINGTRSGGGYTAIGGVTAGVTLGYALNIGCKWQTALQSTQANPTNHWRGALFDVIVGERSGTRTSTAFATSTTGTVSNRTSLYNDQFTVANAQRYGRAVGWSQRRGMPGGFLDAPGIHHLREALPVTLANELHVGATVNRQTGHTAEGFMTIADADWVRQCLIDLGDDTIGITGTSADVVIDDAKMDEWLDEGNAFTIVKARDFPGWHIFRGSSEASWYAPGSYTSWSCALVRANATSLGTPAGRANHLVINAQNGRVSLDAWNRFIRVGLR